MIAGAKRQRPGAAPLPESSHLIHAVSICTLYLPAGKPGSNRCEMVDHPTVWYATQMLSYDGAE